MPILYLGAEGDMGRSPGHFGMARCYGNDAILKGNRNKLRYVESQIRGIMSPWLSGVRELFVAKFRTSNSYRSNRAAGNHHRTAIIFAAWTQ